MRTHKQRFQIYPLWRAFSILCVYGERFHRLRVDGRPKRIKMFAFTVVFVWTGPQLLLDGLNNDVNARRFSPPPTTTTFKNSSELPETQIDSMNIQQ